MNIISNGYRFRRGTGSPFDAVQPVEFDFGVARNGIPCQWCRKCQQSVDTTIEKYNQGQVYGFKQWCKRCGSVTQSAVYYHVQSLTEPETPQVTKAQDWATTTESLIK